jgi:3-oxoacyl-[acyl-carrier-protein] synthase III
MKINNIGIIGIGSYVPKKVLTNQDIDLLGNDTNSDWTKEKLGIEERRVVEDELPSDLAYHAAIEAINDAGIDKNDIDLIMVATSSPDRISPSTAIIMAKRLDIKKPAFDINAVCTGFVYGLQMASTLISTKQYKNILLIGADAYSRITDWNRRDCVFFGDGAGAVILSEVEGGWMSTDLYGDANGKEAFTCHHSGKFQMDGKAVYDFGTSILPSTIKSSLEKLNILKDDVNWIVPHQPGHRVLLKTAEILDFPTDKIVFNMTKFANTAGASIPMALDSLYKKDKIKNGDIIVMPAIGSGWTYGVSILKYIK